MALLPDTGTGGTGTIEVTQTPAQPNKTYKMRIDEERVDGTITDDLEAVKQAVYKILNTERYKHIIYSWNYGVELADLFGKPVPFVLPEIPRRIREALIQDDRINDVTDFNLTYDKAGNVTAEFIVRSVYGDFKQGKVVQIV